MNRLQSALADIGEILDQKGFGWALVGGLAVSVRAEPRFTRDVDLAVAVESDAQAERLVGDLRGMGYEILETVEQETTGRFATRSKSAISQATSLSSSSSVRSYGSGNRRDKQPRMGDVDGSTSFVRSPVPGAGTRFADRSLR